MIYPCVCTEGSRKPLNKFGLAFDKAFRRSREKFKVFWANDLEARGDVEKRGTQLNL